MLNFSTLSPILFAAPNSTPPPSPGVREPSTRNRCSRVERSSFENVYLFPATVLARLRRFHPILGDVGDFRRKRR